MCMASSSDIQYVNIGTKKCAQNWIQKIVIKINKEVLGVGHKVVKYWYQNTN